MENNQNAVQRHRNYNRFLFFMCGLSGLIYGIDIKLMAAALPYMQETCRFSDHQLASITAAVLLGGIPGTFLGGPICERFGRLVCFKLTAVVFAIAVPLVCLSNGNFAMILSGRLLQGVGCSLMSIVAPLFISECAHAKDRGKGTGMIQLVLTIGIFVAGLLGVGVSYLFGDPVPAATATAEQVASMNHAWQSIFWFSILPTGVLFLGCFRLRETPRWFFARGRVEEARASLLMNNDEAAAEAVIADMRVNAGPASRPAQPSQAPQPSQTLLQRKYVIPFVLAVLVVFFNQASGVNTVLNYSVTIFNKAGLVGVEANWADTALTLVNLVMTCVGVALVDCFGRKKLLMIGTAGVVVGLGAAGLAFMCGLGGWFVAVGFMLFMSGFAIGPGVCVWLAMSELVPTRIRANTMMIALFVGMAVSWAIAQAYLPWSRAVGEAKVFFTLAGVAVFYFLTVTFALPETKGKTLEEIERSFQKNAAQ